MAEEHKPIYKVVMQKKTTKSSELYFVVTQIRRDEFTNPSCFHGVGYWTVKHDTGDVVEADITEVWIPWHRIDHVASLMYRQRS